MKTVHYKELYFCLPKLPAIVIPVDHTNHAPGQQVSNLKPVMTTLVKEIRKSDGLVVEFWTKNTHYVLLKVH